MRWFYAISGIEEKAIRTVAEYSRHAAILDGGATPGNGRVSEDFSRINALRSMRQEILVNSRVLLVTRIKKEVRGKGG